MNPRWTNRPDGSNWGDFGPNDQLGRLNLITTEKVKQGIAEVREGRTFCLSLPLDYPGGNVLSPVRFPPQLKPVIRQGGPYYNYQWRQADPRLTDIAADDMVLLHCQYSTQWDSLAHRGSMFDADGDGEPKPVYYNGFRAGDDICLENSDQVEAKRLGIQHMAVHGVQGRGVLVDLFSTCGSFPQVEVGYDRLMKIMEQQQATVEAGDILCLWTGLDQLIIESQGHPDARLKHACAVLDGWDDRLLNWISDSGVAAIAADNIAVEVLGKPMPSQYQGSNLPLHELCLFKLGIHLGELWHLAELANWLREHQRTRFLLTAPPLRLTGAVGSPVTPIATV